MIFQLRGFDGEIYNRLFMRSCGEKAGVLVGLVRACYEAPDFVEFGTRALPLLEKYFDTSTSLLYRCNEEGVPLAIAGPLTECHHYYAENLYAEDPMQPLMQRLNLRLLHAASLPEWKKLSRHPAHTYCSRHYDFGNFVHLRLTEGQMHQPGMVGILLARTERQADFSLGERRLLLHLMPALSALAERNAGDSSREDPLLDCLSEFGGSPKLTFDGRGNLLYASPEAARLLGMTRRDSKSLPKALEAAALRLGKLLHKSPDPLLALPSLRFPRPEAAELRADFHLIEASAQTFIVAELAEAGIMPEIEKLRERHGLTRAESQVLQLIAQGLGDRDIAKRLFISRETVHTHAGRLFDKLGVRTRLQAALLAHGKKIDDPFGLR